MPPLLSKEFAIRCANGAGLWDRSRLGGSGIARILLSGEAMGNVAAASLDPPAQLVETSIAHVQRARQVQRVLADRSQRGRKIPDLLVAAAAEAAGVTVLHYDAGFERIAAVTGQSCQWAVPPGSVD